MRVFSAQVGWSFVLILASMVGIGCKSDPMTTGLSVQVSLNGLAVDQLMFTVSNSTGILVDHQRRPTAPAGPLADRQVVEIYLRDDLSGFVTLDVAGLAADLTVGTSSVNQRLTAGKLVPVMVALAVASSDGGVEHAPDDAADDDAAEVSDAAGLPLASVCGADSDCQSGLCVDGVCCASTCGPCFACNVQNHEGTCVPAPVTTPSAQCLDQKIPCGFDGTCDGNGSCYLPPAGRMCKPGACDGPNLAPAGACDGRGNCITPVKVSCAPFLCSENGPQCRNDCGGIGDCAENATCNNNSCGERPKKAQGDGCVTDVDCLSGFCTDGVCCSARCALQCQSCKQPGQLGSCLAVAAMAPDPHNICVKTSVASCGTNGLCTGTGACQRYAPGTICEEAQCASSSVIGVKKCDASGVCVASGTTSCFPFRCNPATKACGPL